MQRANSDIVILGLNMECKCFVIVSISCILTVINKLIFLCKTSTVNLNNTTKNIEHEYISNGNSINNNYGC